MPRLRMIRETRIGAYGVCIQDDCLLVIMKTRGPYSGLFDLPGGGIEFGETPEHALAREFGEETGAHISVGRILDAYSNTATFAADSGQGLVELHHMGLLYNVLVGDDVRLKTEPDGADSGGAVWLPLDKVSPSNASPLITTALRVISEQA